MPEIGEIQQGREVGYKNTDKKIWQACTDCGKERWVALVQGKPTHARCKHCGCRLAGLKQRGRRSKNWKGGYIKNDYGYREVYVGPDDFFRPMAKKNGYVLEHRLVVAKALGRCLLPWEIVHHKEGFAKGDNRYPETLLLVGIDKHNQMTIMERKIKRLEVKVEEQRKLIKLLEWRFNQKSTTFNLKNSDSN